MLFISYRPKTLLKELQLFLFRSFYERLDFDLLLHLYSELFKNYEFFLNKYENFDYIWRFSSFYL